MRLLDRSCETPEDSLALDEALLRALQAVVASGERRAGEAGGPAGAADDPDPLPPAPREERPTAAPEERNPRIAPGETLRLWESPRPVVVLGHSGRLDEEVDVEACRQAGVPVLRRVSGGGTVMLGPGCLNVTLVLSLPHRPALQDIRRSMAFIVTTMAEALPLEGLGLRGVSDLCWQDWKVSGHAQRRTSHALLHHCTLLYDLDLELMARVLREPPRQPPHRAGRRHLDFVHNLPLTAAVMKTALARAWNAEPDEASPVPSIAEWSRERYEDLLRVE